MQTLLITGANGFLARNFMRKFKDKYNFIRVSHQAQPGHVTLEQLTQEPQQLAKVDLALNLAGASIGARRWTSARKHEIVSSRLTTSDNLVQLLNLHNSNVHLVSASAVGIYPTQQKVDENTVIDYSGYSNFSQEITKQWEQAVLKYHGSLTRARLGVVLAGSEGAFPQMLRPFLLFMGGELGSGQQYMPWIALPDALDLLDKFLTERCNGVFNVVAPEQVTNSMLAKTIATIYQRPNWLHMPSELVRMLFGQMGQELLLNSLEVSSQRLYEGNYPFRYRELSECIQAIKNRQF